MQPSHTPSSKRRSSCPRLSPSYLFSFSAADAEPQEVAADAWQQRQQFSVSPAAASSPRPRHRHTSHLNARSPHNSSSCVAVDVSGGEPAYGSGSSWGDGKKDWLSTCTPAESAVRDGHPLQGTAGPRQPVRAVTSNGRGASPSPAAAPTPCSSFSFSVKTVITALPRLAKKFGCRCLRPSARLRRTLRVASAWVAHGRRSRFLTWLRSVVRKRSARRLHLLVAMLCLVVFTMLWTVCRVAVVLWWTPRPLLPFEVPPPFTLPPALDPPSVLVMHARDAAQTVDESDDTGDTVHTVPDHGNTATQAVREADTRVRLLELPSWTLHVVDAWCADCLDSSTYEAAWSSAGALADATADFPTHNNSAARAVEDQYGARENREKGNEEGLQDNNEGTAAQQHQGRKQEQDAADDDKNVHEPFPSAMPLTAAGAHGVFATSAAPLGRIGPMLLAMASVTDDVDVARELPYWEWVLETFHVRAVTRAAKLRSLTTPEPSPQAAAAATRISSGPGSGPTARKHRRLFVMGIPSTDQPARRALRDAQRATWLSYTRVGRSSNHFDGALLPLYIFAASENAGASAVEGDRTTVKRISVQEQEPQHKGGGDEQEKEEEERKNSEQHTLSVEAVRGPSLETEAALVAALLPTRLEFRRAAQLHVAAAARSSPSGTTNTSAPLAATNSATPPADQRSAKTAADPSFPLFYVRRMYRMRSGVHLSGSGGGRVGANTNNNDDHIKYNRGDGADGGVAAAHTRTGARQKAEVEPLTDYTANGAHHTPLSGVGVCGAVAERRVSTLFVSTTAAGAATDATTSAHESFASPLASLAQSLHLPITPSFVAPARYVCTASPDLWQEALTHRNAVWIDMMTDRKPTTNKKLRGTGHWGLPVEVGMSQKTILWLHYAYHAFPDVPYIMKGDDDTYLKVPQFLSDMNMLRTGRREAAVELVAPLPFHSFPSRSFIVNKAASHITEKTLRGADGGVVRSYGIDDPPLAEEECIYWGATRIYLNRTAFNPGPGYAVQRRLLRVVLETPPGEDANRDVLRLATEAFLDTREPWYTYNTFQNEDAMIGTLLKDRGERAKALCPHRRWWLMREVSRRHHDAHRGKVENITWATVAVHRCSVADYYYIHHYFATEYSVARAAAAAAAAGAMGDAADPELRRKLVEAAEAEAARWVSAQLKNESEGWDRLPAVAYDYDPATDPAFAVDAEDGVALYDMPYEPWSDGERAVVTGGTSRLRMVRGWFDFLFSR